MNKDKAREALAEFNITRTANLTIIIFSNSKCVTHFGDECAIASYEYNGNYKAIKIGDYDNSDVNTLIRMLKHELKHHEQNLQKRLPLKWGLPQEFEDEAQEAEYS